ncbi:hypothetical protein PG991_013522 [Apiospora marii]|uniref:Uncharacterized protein n=1 Tax=Apiospora marii TaxID=335849 RepID=A0ABR1R676_9PEZI
MLSDVADDAENGGLALPAIPTSLARQVPARGINGGILLAFLENGKVDKISYNTISAFEEHVWTSELQDAQRSFQEKNPHDILPLGILKVGLLNYWWARREQDEPDHFPSLARYLGTVFPNDAVGFDRKAYSSDEASLGGSCTLSYKIDDSSINSELCMKLLDQKNPQRLCYLLTADLQGAGNIHADSNCRIMKEYIEVEGVDPPPQKEAIKSTVELIGNVGLTAAGQLVQWNEERHAVVLPMSMRAGDGDVPLETFSGGTPSVQELDELAKKHNCIIYDFTSWRHSQPIPPREPRQSPERTDTVRASCSARTPAAGEPRPADPSRGAAGARRPNVSKRIPEIPPSIVEEPSDAPRLQEALAKLRNCAGLVIQVKGKVDKFREMRVPGVKAALERLEKGLKTQMANGRKVRDAYLDLGGDTNQVPSVLREDKTPAEGETVQDQKTANPIKEGPSPDAKNSAPKPPVKAAGAEDKAPESPVIEVTKAAHPEPQAGIPATPLNKEEPPAVVPDHSTTNHGDQGDDTVKPTADPLTQTHQEKDATAQKPGAPVFDLPGDDTVASDADATKLDGSRKDPVVHAHGSAVQDETTHGDQQSKNSLAVTLEARVMTRQTPISRWRMSQKAPKLPSLLETRVRSPPLSPQDKDPAAARSDSPKLAPEAKDTVDVNPDPNRQGNDGVQQEARAPEVGVPLPDVMQGIEPPAAAAGSKVPKADLLGKDTVAVKAVPQT